MLVKRCLDPAAAVFVVMMGQRIYAFITNFFQDSLFGWLHFFKDSWQIGSHFVLKS